MGARCCDAEMPKVIFTPALKRHVNCPDTEVIGTTVRQALSAVFEQYPKARGYILDDAGAVRHHVVIFADGTAIADRATQSDAVSRESEIYVMQALSGG